MLLRDEVKMRTEKWILGFNNMVVIGDLENCFVEW